MSDHRCDFVWFVHRNQLFLSQLLRRTAAEAMVMNPLEPVKEKEKQGFFRAIKKKKKKTQIVRSD